MSGPSQFQSDFRKLKTISAVNTRLYWIIFKSLILRFYCPLMLFLTVYITAINYLKHLQIDTSTDTHRQIMESQYGKHVQDMVQKSSNMVIEVSNHFVQFEGISLSVLQIDSISSFDQSLPPTFSAQTRLRPLSQCVGRGLCFSKIGGEVQNFDNLSIDDKEFLLRNIKYFARLDGQGTQNSFLGEDNIAYSVHNSSSNLTLFWLDSEIVDLTNSPERMKDCLRYCQFICSESTQESFIRTDFSNCYPLKSNFKQFLTKPVYSFYSKDHLTNLVLKICSQIEVDVVHCSYYSPPFISNGLNYSLFRQFDLVLNKNNNINFLISRIIQEENLALTYYDDSPSHSESYFKDRVEESFSFSQNEVEFENGVVEIKQVYDVFFFSVTNEDQMVIKSVVTAKETRFLYNLNGYLLLLMKSYYQQNLILIVLFLLNLIITHFFIEYTIKDLLHRISQICDLVGEGEVIMDLNFPKPKYQELADLVHSIVYYFVIIKFVSSVQEDENFSVENMQLFLKHFKTKNNYESRCYLYRSLMVAYSVENCSPMQLEQAIQYGLRLYSLYEERLESLSKMDTIQKYEVRKMNTHIFKLLKILLSLIMRGADSNISYNYDEADAIHDQLMKYFNILNLNDTIHLSLILKRVTILLKIEKFSIAEANLIEAEKLVDLLLKNGRMLSYMKEQYFLLTYLKQKTFHLKGLLFARKNDSLRASENYYQAITYGPVYRRKHRIEVLEDFKKTINIVKSKDLGFSYQISLKQDILHLLDNIKNFVTRKRREIIFMFDNSTPALPYLQKIKPIIEEVCNDALHPRDLLGIECYSKKLMRLVELKKVGSLGKPLKKKLSKAFLEMRRMQTCELRDYYHSMQHSLSLFLGSTQSKNNDESFQLTNLPKKPRDRRRVMTSMQNIDQFQQRFSRLSQHDISEENIRYFVMGVFGEYNPYTKHNIDEIQKLLNDKYFNLCVITHDVSILEKEKLYKIILSAKRSVIIDIHPSRNTTEEIATLLKNFFN